MRALLELARAAGLGRIAAEFLARAEAAQHLEHRREIVGFGAIAVVVGIAVGLYLSNWIQRLQKGAAGRDGFSLEAECDQP